MKNDTAAAIRNALTNILKRHSMDGITVKWICLEAGVSKQTFYNHYYGVGEVLEAICRDICAEAAGEGKAGEDGGTICRKILGAVCRHRDVLIHLYRSGRREEVGAMLRRECAALLIPVMEACTEPDAGEREEGDGARRLYLTFPEEYRLEAGWTYRLTAPIEPTPYAYSLYAEAGSSYPECMEGEEDTGITSAGEAGFYSNADDTALLRYRLDDEEREKEYPMPVIQVRAPGGGPVLPATGSCGVVLFRSGGILSAGAGWALLRRRRRREEHGD